jgi:hypothetical protein
MSHLRLVNVSFVSRLPIDPFLSAFLLVSLQRGSREYFVTVLGLVGGSRA